jgi:hypothetical protein
MLIHHNTLTPGSLYFQKKVLKVLAVEIISLVRSCRFYFLNSYIKRIWWSVYVVLILTVSTFSCSRIPQIYNTEFADSDNDILNKCQSVFPDGDRQFVHSIEATLSGKNNAFMLGVTQIYPQSGTIRAIMMTFEGLVLFDAFYDGKVIINRAIPPFDSKFFAQGLMEDIRLIFFQPKGTTVEISLTNTGGNVCRYHHNHDDITDVTIDQSNILTINRYHQRRLYRTVRLHQGKTANDPSIFQRVELIAYRPAKYKMDLNLLESEPINR